MDAGVSAGRAPEKCQGCSRASEEQDLQRVWERTFLESPLLEEGPGGEWEVSDKVMGEVCPGQGAPRKAKDCAPVHGDFDFGFLFWQPRARREGGGWHLERSVVETGRPWVFPGDSWGPRLVQVNTEHRRG